MSGPATRLTEARRRGLEVLACAPDHTVRVAKRTDPRQRRISSQVADWLYEEGLAERWLGEPHEARLTIFGAELAREEGLL